MSSPTEPQKLLLEDFKIFDKPLGIGAFGTVHMAKHIKNGSIFALKIINLAKLRGPLEHEFAKKEVKLHSKVAHKNIIKFFGVIKNNDMLYHVLEFAENGNLYKIIKKKTKMSEPQIFRFFYQTLLALKYLHENDIMHRDIKPENLLLDKNNNIKLCDFGWSDTPAKDIKYHFCGTYEYMAPEVVERKAHNYKVDIWSLGVLLYELVYGFTPFRAKGEGDKEGIMENIKKTELKFETPINEELKSLIQSMVVKDPSKRIEIKEIFNHPWIQKRRLSAIQVNVPEIQQKEEKPKDVEKVAEPKIENPVIPKSLENSKKVDKSPCQRVNKCPKFQEPNQKQKDPPLKLKTIKSLEVTKANISAKKRNIFEKKNTLEILPSTIYEMSSILSKVPQSATKNKSFLLMSVNSENRIFTEECEHEETNRKEQEFQRNMLESMRGFDQALNDRKRGDLSIISEFSAVEISDEGMANRVNLFIKNTKTEESVLKYS